MGCEIDGAIMGDEFKGYVFRINGGNDKQGFAMKQGILVNGRTRILFRKGKFFVLIIISRHELLPSPLR